MVFVDVKNFGKLALELKNLTIGYKSPLVENINIRIEKGKLIAIIGRNGVGKTTFLKTLAKLIKPLSGQIILQNIDIQKIPLIDFAKKITYASNQHFFIPHLKVSEFIEFGYYPYLKKGLFADSNHIEKSLFEIANYLKIRYLLDKNLDQISDGERQKVNLARLLLQNADFWLLDEPTVFYDLENKFSLFSVFSDLKNKGKTILFSTHQLYLAVHFADFMIIIDNGKLFFDYPENFVFNGFLKKIFKPQNAVFNDFFADFFVSYTTYKPIRVLKKTQNKIKIFWTLISLKKRGFLISKNADKVLIIDDFGWIFFNKGKKLIFKNFSQFLKNIDNEN